MRKTPLFISGRTVMVRGPAYHMPRVLDAHRQALDAFVSLFGPGKFAVDVGAQRYELPWPGEGQTVSREVWEGFKRLADADSISTLFLLPTLSIRSYLLGLHWCVQQVDTRAITLYDGGDVADINPVPCMEVIGPWNRKRRAFDLLPETAADAVTGLAAGLRSSLGLDFRRSSALTPRSAETGETDSCLLFFPHETYGAGRALLSVKCLASDGSDPEPTPQPEN